MRKKNNVFRGGATFLATELWNRDVDLFVLLRKHTAALAPRVPMQRIERAERTRRLRL